MFIYVWGRFLLNDDHKTKHQYRVIPRADIRVSLSTTLHRISDIVRRKQAQNSHWVTDWLKLFVIFQ